MSRLNLRRKGAGESGFSLVELLVVISLVGIIVVTFSSFFTNYLILYSKYQQDSLAFSEMAQQSQRVVQVLRGLTDIVSESDNDITAYAYFSPADTYVSLVHYYLSADSKKLMVDVTPMSANPPIGSPITAQKKTYTVISNYYQAPGTKLFIYYDSNGTVLTAPVGDEHSIIEIEVNLTEPASHGTKQQSLSVTVSLRNRKTNL